MRGRIELITLAYQLALCCWRDGTLTSQSKGLFANSGINSIQFPPPHVEAMLDLYSNGSQSPSRLVWEAKSWKWHHCPRASVCFPVCWLMQTETVVGVHHCVSACMRTANEIWITATEIWIIWRISIPPTAPLKHRAVMFYVSLLSFVSLPFLFLSRSKGGSTEERKGAGEALVVAIRPDVAYNLLHTLFYGLLAFSTMRWVHAHTHI